VLYIDKISSCIDTCSTYVWRGLMHARRDVFLRWEGFLSNDLYVECSKWHVGSYKTQGFKVYKSYSWINIFTRYHGLEVYLRQSTTGGNFCSMGVMFYLGNCTTGVTFETWRRSSRLA
jgi:hypothetical protein